MVDVGSMDRIAIVTVEWAATYLVHSTLLILSVALIVRLWRGLSLRNREWLWRAALFGGFMTASTQMAFGWAPLAGTFDLGLPSRSLSTQPALATDPTVVERHVWVRETDSLRIVAQVTPLADVAAAAAELGPAKQTADAPLWPLVLAGLWILGLTVGAARLIHGAFQLRNTLRARRDVVEDPLLEQFLLLCDQNGWTAASSTAKRTKRRRIRLTMTPTIRSPLALPREIVVPPRILDDLDAQQQRAVLAHEMAHVLRRDPQWRWWMAVYSTIFFFQPMHLWARRRLHELAEYQADRWSAEHSGSSTHLAKALAIVSRWVDGPTTAGRFTPSPYGMPMAAGGSAVLRRVRELTRSPSRQDPAWLAAGLAGGLIVLVGLMAPAATHAASEPAPSVAPHAGSAANANSAASERVTESWTADGRRAVVQLQAGNELVHLDIESHAPPPPPESTWVWSMTLQGDAHAAARHERLQHKAERARRRAEARVRRAEARLRARAEALARLHTPRPPEVPTVPFPPQRSDIDRILDPSAHRSAPPPPRRRADIDDLIDPPSTPTSPPSPNTSVDDLLRSTPSSASKARIVDL